MIAVHPKDIQWAIVMVLLHPVPMTRLQTDLKLQQKSKLELIALLRSSGWQPVDGQIVPYVFDEHKVFTQKLAKPQSYFAVLVAAHDIHAKVGLGGNIAFFQNSDQHDSSGFDLTGGVGGSHCENH